jgi:diguanylate cyclase (GGDEF)-like protein
LQQAFRAEDIVSRLGGDEFVALTRSGGQESLAQLERRIRDYFAKHNASSGKPYSVNCSLGCHIIPSQSTDSLDEVLSHADRMMYAEKRLRRTQRMPHPTREMR